MADFSYTDLLPTGPDGTEYRLLSNDGMSVEWALGRDFLEVEPEVLTKADGSNAMHDIAHLLRAAHLRQLRSILDDPEASGERQVRRQRSAQERPASRPAVCCRCARTLALRSSWAAMWPAGADRWPR